MTVVLQNFYTDAKRLASTRRVYEGRGLTMIDDVQAGDKRRVDWIVTKTRYIDDEFVAGFASLRGVVVLGTEPWMVALRSSPVQVFTLEEDRGYEVAEHAITLLLAGMKRLPNASLSRRPLSVRGVLSLFRAPRAGEVHGGHNWSGAVTDTLYGRKVGIVGYGLIGREIHKRLAGFGTDVLYHNRAQYPSELERRLRISHASVETLFAECDAILVQLPLTPGTEGLISARVLGQAKSNLVLVNCGRAGVIDEDALYEALRRKAIAYYAADVFWREPIPMLDRFRRLDNCLLTPHMAESLPGRTHNLLEKAVEIIATLSEVTEDGNRTSSSGSH